MTLLQIY